jgi:hypothetical protein
MKIKNTQKRSYSKAIPAFSALVIVLALAAGSLVYVYAFGGNLLGWKRDETTSKTSDSKVNLDAPTNEQVDAGNQVKKDTANGSEGTTQPSTNVDVSITAANQNGSMFQIRTLIGAVTSDGTCTLTLTKGATVVTKSAGIQAQSSSSTCQGFDIPVSELSAGDWTLNLSVATNSLSGSTTSKITVH